MGTTLQERIKQTKGFASLAEEAMLGLIVASADVEEQLEQVCRRYGIGSSQYNVLRILRGAPPEGYPRNEIIDRMLDSAPDVTRLTDALARRGFVRRGRCRADRRKMMHQITRAGRRLLDEMEKDIESVHVCFAQQLDEVDLLELVRLCERIYGHRSAESH